MEISRFRGDVQGLHGVQLVEWAYLNCWVDKGQKYWCGFCGSITLYLYNLSVPKPQLGSNNGGLLQALKK